MRGAAAGALLVLPLGVWGACYQSNVELQTSCLDACRGALANADLQLHVNAWTELQASFSDAIAADKAYADAASTLTGFVQSLATGNAGLPGGFSYQGNGVVSASPTGDAQVAVSFFLPVATSYGKVGDPIRFDVFDPASYFQGLTVSAGVSVSLSGVSTGYQFQFSKAGPGAELLGLGPSPSSPLSVDVGQLGSKLGAVTMSATSSVSRKDGTTAIAFGVLTGSRRADAVSGATFSLQIQGFTGARTDLGQVLSVGSIALSSARGGSALDGTALVHSQSPTFSFQMLFHFPSSALADVAFGCPNVVLTPP